MQSYSLIYSGARSHAPENTLLSFKLALDMNVDRVECDVRLTKDKQLVVIHDDAIDRTSNGKGKVSGFTLAVCNSNTVCPSYKQKEVLKFDFGSQERIPTLDQLLMLVKPSGKTLHIELKGLKTFMSSGLLWRAWCRTAYYRMYP